MAHFARVNQGKVEEVIVAEQDFIDNLVSDAPGEWIKTSYNVHSGVYINPETGVAPDNQEDYINDNYPERKRKNFAGRNWTYDYENDMFVEPKPIWDSWTLNMSTGRYDPPVAYPDDGGRYEWNEETQSWDADES